MEEKATLHNLALHEVMEIDRFTYAMRVPGGWIYQLSNAVMDEDGNISNSGYSCVFVPYYK